MFGTEVTMSANPTSRPLKLPSAEGKTYTKKLREMAAEQLAATEDEWYRYWPDVSQYAMTAHHSTYGDFDSPKALVAKVETDQIAGHQAICVVESINIYWTGELGALLKLDPQFFIDHMKVLNQTERFQTLEEARYPNAAGGLKSSRGESWTTLRGSVDIGRINKAAKNKIIHDACRRGVEKSLGENYFSHTNVSVYAVNQHFRKSIVKYMAVRA